MTRAGAVVAVTACLTASAASAQEFTPEATLLPPCSARWDAAVHVTWLGERRTEQFFEWDRWIGMASGGGTVGYYWTPHLKTEFDVSTSTEGESYSLETVLPPGARTPLFIQRDHEISFTTASAGLAGQFFENAWFHPFLGAGIEFVREREHIETLPPPFPPGDPRAIGPAPESETRVRYGARPYVAAGFKVYVSERAFIRSDIRTSWSGAGLASMAWRSGVGVDF